MVVFFLMYLLLPELPNLYYLSFRPISHRLSIRFNDGFFVAVCRDNHGKNKYALGTMNTIITIAILVKQLKSARRNKFN